jgi:hypothetical protein
MYIYKMKHLYPINKLELQDINTVYDIDELTTIPVIVEIISNSLIRAAIKDSCTTYKYILPDTAFMQTNFNSISEGLMYNFPGVRIKYEIMASGIYDGKLYNILKVRSDLVKFLDRNSVKQTLTFDWSN